MSNKIPILVHMNTDLIEQLKMLTEQLGMTRSELIRRSLRRDLRFIQDVELKKIQDNQGSLAISYQRYISQEPNITTDL